MNNQKSPIPLKYILYARKSTESEDRQVASIQSQISELLKIAKTDNLNIIEVLEESQSAKEPGRPIFNNMLKMIEHSKASGILCWKLDRLSRNPVDGGKVQWLLQQSIIQHIRTFERSYYPQDNVLMMNIEMGMATQFIRDLSSNTIRGLQSKILKGWAPILAPVGYLNDKFANQGEKKIIPDPERFHIIQKLWKLLLSKQYSVGRIYRIAISDYKLTLRSGKVPVRSKFYGIFNNLFYTGMFKYKDEIHKGSHTPMITMQEYEQAKSIIHSRQKPQPHSHIFPFTGIIKCGVCGSAITAIEKSKTYKNGKSGKWIYYQCCKSRNADCTQSKTYMSEKDLSLQIVEFLKKIEISEDFYKYTIAYLRKENEKDAEAKKETIRKWTDRYNTVFQNLSKLIDMKLSEQISLDEYIAKKNELIIEKERLSELLKDAENNVGSWVDCIDSAFIFAKGARKVFNLAMAAGDIETQRQILSVLGTDIRLQDNKLMLKFEEPLSFLGSVSRLGVGADVYKTQNHTRTSKKFKTSSETKKFLNRCLEWGS